MDYPLSVSATTSSQSQLMLRRDAVQCPTKYAQPIMPIVIRLLCIAIPCVHWTSTTHTLVRLLLVRALRDRRETAQVSHSSMPFGQLLSIIYYYMK